MATGPKTFSSLYAILLSVHPSIILTLSVTVIILVY